MWVEGQWFPKGLISQIVLLWLLGVVIAAGVLWRLSRKTKRASPQKRIPHKHRRRHRGK